MNRRTPLEHEAPAVVCIYQQGDRRVEVWSHEGERAAVLVERERLTNYVRLPRRAKN